MYALAEAALADAQIACWDSTTSTIVWRPITAIRLGDQDGNPFTDVDPNWQLLTDRPNFPEYPSGHVDISGAISRHVQLFVRSDVLSFQMTTIIVLALQKPAHYQAVAGGAGGPRRACVVGHPLPQPDITARRQGRRVANCVFRHYLRPVDGAKDNDDFLEN